MVRIAFATSDGTAVDQHFGSCRRFDVYEVRLRDALLFEVREFTIQQLEELDKIDSRVAAVRDCAILNMCSIGGTAAARVIKAGIHPMRIESGTPIEGLLDRFVRVLADGAPPWLRKAMYAHDPDVPPVWPLAPTPASTAIPLPTLASTAAARPGHQSGGCGCGGHDTGPSATDSC
ncbi:nitrogen fixation protein NifX [Frankia tisae]|uniref:nitrogen fixation protein NifX n=1 Tax=Frankia tisae TaxID=2950104 RepID=UPI0021BEDC2E|nr:nitrogen fixation protein NifX [Frankia tisae]